MQHYTDILIIIGSLGAMMYGMLKFMLRDIHKDLTEIKGELKAHDERINTLCKRIDHLYQICVEMLGMRHKH